MISKELLSEVLSYDKELSNIKKDGNSIVFSVGDRLIMSSINIHELAHKVKEWANKQNYDDNTFTTIVYDDMSAKAIITSDGFSFMEDTEPEAVFKAGQWILDNR